MPDILALGEPMLEFNQLSENHRTVYLPGYGGDTSNVAVAAARQGASVGMLTRLGQDSFGDEFIKLWQAEGIDTSQIIRDNHAATGIYFVTHSEQGHAFTYFRKGSAASLIKPEELPVKAIAEAKLLHVSGISQAISNSACDTVFAAMEIAKAHNVKISYDTNLRLKLWPLNRAKAIIMETIAHSDICLPSLEDVTSLTGLRDPDTIVDFFLNRGAGIVALKLGAKGVLVADATQRQRLDGFKVQTVDATGAGDSFDGAFIAQLLAGASLAQAARYANAAAALSTKGHGAVTPIPSRQEVEAFLNSQTV